jgi:hypothetical protein
MMVIPETMCGMNGNNNWLLGAGISEAQKMGPPPVRREITRKAAPIVQQADEGYTV